MEVTNKNFLQSLPEIEEIIEKADFVAIDAEFTGLRRDASYSYNELDTAEERYVKAKNAAKEFGMVQFGLTTFRYIPKERKYTHASFYFYTLGQMGDILAYDTSSLRFLARNGFDFNKLINEGLPFITMKDEEEKRTGIMNHCFDSPAPSPVKVTETNAQKFLEGMELKMMDFSTDESKEVLTIPGSTLNGFFRKILYSNIGAKYPNYLVRNVNQNDERNIEIRKFKTMEDRREFLESDMKNQLNEQVGFTHVVRKILETEKPIIGHNLILDLFHLINKTIQPLPDHLDQFKKIINSNLPTVYDTKLIAKDPPFCGDITNTALGNLFKELCDKYKPPVLEVEKGYTSYNCIDASKAHNAGYDAFMTGVCFLTMVKRLDGENWFNKSVVKSKHLRLYANRINNMNSYDIPYLHLKAPDVVPNRSHIFCVDCPSSWTTANVHGLFHMLKSLKIVWKSNTKFYVIPIEEIDSNICREHLKNLKAVCPPLVHVRLYDDKQILKRKESDDTPKGDIDATARRPQEFKRLKSVGSDQLSQMSLESPVSEESPSLKLEGQGKKKRGNSDASDGVFQIPEDW